MWNGDPEPVLTVYKHKNSREQFGIRPETCRKGFFDRIFP